MFRSAMLQSNRVVVSAGGWTPASLPNVVSWWRAQDEPTGVMSSWTDLSGNGNHLTQATAAKKPINTAAQINGKSAVIFDGVDDFLKATFTLNQPTEVWLVYQSRSVKNYSTIFDGATTSSLRLWPVAAAPSVDMRASSATFIREPTAATVGVYHAVSALYNTTSSILNYDNGTPVTGNVGTNNAGGFSLGALASGGGATPIDVADAFILSAASTAAEKTDIYTYLNSQYGWAL